MSDFDRDEFVDPEPFLYAHLDKHFDPVDGPPPPVSHWSLSRTDGLWHVEAVFLDVQLADYTTTRLSKALRVLVRTLRCRP